MTEEIFYPIKNGRGIYEISKTGRIRRKNSKPRRGVPEYRYINGMPVGGYVRVTLSLEINKPWQYSVHRIIAETFIHNPENKPFVNHINGIKNDNRIENLEWCTMTENNLHARDTRLNNVDGERHHWSKLKDKDVVSIRKMMSNGIKQREISKIFGITEATVSDIKYGKSHKRTGK